MVAEYLEKHADVAAVALQSEISAKIAKMVGASLDQEQCGATTLTIMDLVSTYVATLYFCTSQWSRTQQHVGVQRRTHLPC